MDSYFIQKMSRLLLKVLVYVRGLYLFVRLSLYFLKATYAENCSLFRLVDFKKRSFLIPCVF